MKKLDFKKLNGTLSRDQMKKVIGGGYPGGTCCADKGLICTNGTHCCMDYINGAACAIYWCTLNPC